MIRDIKDIEPELLATNIQKEVAFRTTFKNYLERTTDIDEIYNMSDVRLAEMIEKYVKLGGSLEDFRGE